MLTEHHLQSEALALADIAMRAQIANPQLFDTNNIPPDVPVSVEQIFTYRKAYQDEWERSHDQNKAKQAAKDSISTPEQVAQWHAENDNRVAAVIASRTSPTDTSVVEDGKQLYTPTFYLWPDECEPAPTPAEYQALKRKVFDAGSVNALTISEAIEYARGYVRWEERRAIEPDEAKSLNVSSVGATAIAASRMRSMRVPERYIGIAPMFSGEVGRGVAENGGCFIFGDAGRASAVACSFLGLFKGKGLYATAFETLDAGAWRQELWEQANLAHLLVLDGVSQVNADPKRLTWLYQLLKTRRDNRNPTLVTSSLSLDELDAQFSAAGQVGRSILAQVRMLKTLRVDA